MRRAGRRLCKHGSGRRRARAGRASLKRWADSVRRETPAAAPASPSGPGGEGRGRACPSCPPSPPPPGHPPSRHHHQQRLRQLRRSRLQRGEMMPSVSPSSVRSTRASRKLTRASGHTEHEPGVGPGVGAACAGCFCGVGVFAAAAAGDLAAAGLGATLTGGSTTAAGCGAGGCAAGAGAAGAAGACRMANPMLSDTVRQNAFQWRSLRGLNADSLLRTEHRSAQLYAAAGVRRRLGFYRRKCISCIRNDSPSVTFRLDTARPLTIRRF